MRKLDLIEKREIIQKIKIFR